MQQHKVFLCVFIDDAHRTICIIYTLYQDPGWLVQLLPAGCLPASGGQGPGGGHTLQRRGDKGTYLSSSSSFCFPRAGSRSYHKAVSKQLQHRAEQNWLKPIASPTALGRNQRCFGLRIIFKQIKLMFPDKEDYKNALFFKMRIYSPEHNKVKQN